MLNLTGTYNAKTGITKVSASISTFKHTSRRYHAVVTVSGKQHHLNRLYYTEQRAINAALRLLDEI